MLARTWGDQHDEDKNGSHISAAGMGFFDALTTGCLMFSGISVAMLQGKTGYLVVLFSLLHLLDRHIDTFIQQLKKRISDHRVVMLLKQGKGSLADVSHETHRVYRQIHRHVAFNST